MLVLSRQEGERIHIGADIVLTVTSIRGSVVRIGIEAPREVRILREEMVGQADTTEESRRELAEAFA